MNVAIGFSTSPAWYSRLIRWATGAKCSHAFLVVDIAGVPMVLEEAATGYTMKTLVNKYVDGSQIVAIMEPRVDLSDAVIASFDWLGQRYDYTGLLGMAWVEVCRYFRHKVSNPFSSKHAMFCSQEVTKVMQVAKWPHAEVLDPSTTDPEMLRRFICVSWGVDP